MSVSGVPVAALVNVAVAFDPRTAQVSFASYKWKEEQKHTRKTALDLEQLLPCRVHRRKRRVDVQMLLDNVKEVVPREVEHRLAPRQRQDFALHAEDGLAGLEGDVEAVAREGHDLFAEDDDFGLPGQELVPDAELLGDGSEGHGGGGWGLCLLVGVLGLVLRCGLGAKVSM